MAVCLARDTACATVKAKIAANKHRLYRDRAWILRRGFPGRRQSWALTLRPLRNIDTGGGQTPFEPFMHRQIGAFDVMREASRVEQRIGVAVGRELGFQRRETCRMPCQFQRQCLAFARPAEFVINSGSPTARLSRLAATRRTKVDPRRVSTGTPAPSASDAVVCALNGNVSRKGRPGECEPDGPPCFPYTAQSAADRDRRLVPAPRAADCSRRLHWFATATARCRRFHGEAASRYRRPAA